MTKTSKRAVFLLIALLPSSASANAGTALMWASMLHLFIGNALLGIGEGLLLSWWFRTPKGKTTGLLILANYASAWIGGALFSFAFPGFFHVTIENIRLWFWASVAIAFLVTLVIEFPFILMALRGREQLLKTAARAALSLHMVSYTLLFGWYWLASGTSMLTELDIVPVERMQPPAGHELYFIPLNRREVVRTDLDGKNPETLATLPSSHRNDRLLARANDAGGCDLFVHLGDDERDKEREMVLLRDFAEAAPIDWRIARDASAKSEGTWVNFGRVSMLSTHSEWEYWTGFWPVEGIRGWRRRDDARFRFALETPFASWEVRNATHIAGDFAVFQLGAGQICILQPQQKKIALIVRGKGPLVALGRGP